MGIHLISIIMPAYNASKYISEAIQSVLNQSYPHWELIIVNDGSKDDTEDVIRSFRDTRIKYFKQQNQGVGSARNLGLNNMEGNYFCFLDSDDVLTCRSLEARLKIFEGNSQIGFVDGRVEKWDENLEKLKEVYLPAYKGNPLPELISLSNSCFFGPSWMVKIDNDREKRYQFRTDITHAEDLLFYIDIANEGMYSFTEETILLYRVRRNSAMADLKGLEGGYREVYKEVSSLANIQASKLSYLKMRIIRIMVLSYLRSYNLKYAVTAAFSLLKL